MCIICTWNAAFVPVAAIRQKSITAQVKSGTETCVRGGGGVFGLFAVGSWHRANENFTRKIAVSLYVLKCRCDHYHQRLITN